MCFACGFFRQQEEAGENHPYNQDEGSHGNGRPADEPCGEGYGEDADVCLEVEEDEGRDGAAPDERQHQEVQGVCPEDVPVGRRDGMGGEGAEEDNEAADKPGEEEEGGGYPAEECPAAGNPEQEQGEQEARGEKGGGEVSGEADVKEITVPEIIRMMVGREFSREQKKEREQTKEVIFSVQNLTNKKLQDISFDLNKGEVLGIGGLIDAGRTEVLRAVFGIDPCGGTMFFEGKPICNKSPRDAIANGFSFVPEDRKDQGLILMADILSNVEFNFL